MSYCDRCYCLDKVFTGESDDLDLEGIILIAYNNIRLINRRPISV